MLDKEKVKELYLEGYNAVYIAQVLGASKFAVQKCIQRNLHQFKTSHQASIIYNREVDRVTKREAKQFMSDKDFIKRNPSIYKTRSNGDIVINKALAGTVAFDTPRRLTNEYSEERVNNNIIHSGYRKEELLFG